MPMSRRFRKILGIAALLGLVFLTGFFINAFYGNPSRPCWPAIPPVRYWKNSSPANPTPSRAAAIT